MKNIRVNIRTAINASQIQIERKPKYKGGDDYTIIKNHKWMIDGIVLNGGLYSKEENEKGYQSMNGRLFTAGHPSVNNQFVCISSQDNILANEALASHYIGASIVNVRKSGADYLEDIEINNRVAESHPDGVELLNWCDKVENGELPESIHTSTGLLCQRVNLEGESRGKKYTWIASNQKYDHNALLVGMTGAGGDEISLSVNEDGEELETMTVNLDDPATVENKIKKTAWSKLVSFVTNKSDRSFEQTIGIISQGLRSTYSTDDNWVYVVAVYNDYVIYESGDSLFKVSYLIDSEEKINFVGEPVKVKREVEYEEVETNEEVDPMKEKMIAALNQGGVATEGLDDDQLFNEYSKLMATPKQESNSLTAEDVAKIVTDTIAANKAEEAKQKKASLVEKVIATNASYTEDDKEALLETNESLLEKMVVKSSDKFSPAFNGDRNKSSLTNELPE